MVLIKKIGLYNLEPNIVNTAMMQVSNYHKNEGDNVEIYNHILKSTYDKTYAFSIFDYTDKNYVTEDMIIGGTGFDVQSKLPEEIEKENYDWSLYPNCDFSLIWFSRGCPRKCPFCVVPNKEGNIRRVECKNLNPNGKYIKVCDNNFFANPLWGEAIRQIKVWNRPIDFCGGIDVRILTEEMCDALNSLNYRKNKDNSTISKIKIAWDNPKENIIPKLKEVIKLIKPYKLMCYVLIGYWSTHEQDLYRVNKLKELGIDPFVMPYDKNDEYQKKFARWVNMKAIFKSVGWRDYQHKNV